MSKKKILSSYFKQVDMFPQDITFRENGGESFGSNFGACTSLVIALIVCLYGMTKFTVLINY